MLASRRKAQQPDSPLLAEDLAALGHDLLKKSRWSEAEPLLREAVMIRERATPDDWQRYDATSLLGGSLLGQGRYVEAEPLIVAGYEGIKARECAVRCAGQTPAARGSHAAWCGCTRVGASPNPPDYGKSSSACPICPQTCSLDRNRRPYPARKRSCGVVNQHWPQWASVGFRRLRLPTRVVEKEEHHEASTDLASCSGDAASPPPSGIASGHEQPRDEIALAGRTQSLEAIRFQSARQLASPSRALCQAGSPSSKTIELLQPISRTKSCQCDNMT